MNTPVEAYRLRPGKNRQPDQPLKFDQPHHPTTFHRFSLTPIRPMKSILVTFRNLRLAVLLTLGLSLGNVAWSKPSIQSIGVSPNPLTTGQNFTIAVTASPDVTQATATVGFRPGEP